MLSGGKQLVCAFSRGFVDRGRSVGRSIVAPASLAVKLIIAS